MIEDIEFNDLNDAYEDGADSDGLYTRHFASEPGWNHHSFHVWDMWEVGRCPYICVKYENQGREFFLRLYFEGDTYHKINGFKLDVGSDTLFHIENVNLTLNDFFVCSPQGDFLNGSEDKCIKLINRYWNLKAFL